MRLFPKVTTSRKEFIDHIIKVCEASSINDHKQEKWLEEVKSCVSVAHYFSNMIFVETLSPYLLLHEVSHHITNILRWLTVSKFWYKLDTLINLIDLLM